MKKKTFLRVGLFAAAFLTGTGLGKVLLIGFEPMKICLFTIACVVLGNVFRRIDEFLNRFE